MRDEGEPPLEDVTIRSSELTTTSLTDGSYFLEDIPPGEIHLEVAKQGFPFVALSLAKLLTADDIPLKVTGDTQLDIGLMHGWMTWPFQTEEDAWLSSYVELDYQLGSIRNYAGENRPCDFEGPRIAGTCDNHQGIDWDAHEGTPILAVGPGVVIDVDGMAPSGALHLHILHQFGSRAFVTHYGHYSASTVKLGGWVSRGQPVALVGTTGTSHPHLHLGLWEVPPRFETHQVLEIFDYIYRTHAVMVPYQDGREVPAVLDPFRDVTDPGSESLWTVDNDPQFP